MPFLHERIETVHRKTPTKNDTCGQRRHRSALLLSYVCYGPKGPYQTVWARAVCLLSSLCSHPIFLGFVMLMFKSLNLHLVLSNSINEYMFYFHHSRSLAFFHRHSCHLNDQNYFTYEEEEEGEGTRP